MLISLQLPYCIDFLQPYFWIDFEEKEKKNEIQLMSSVRKKYYIF